MNIPSAIWFVRVVGIQLAKDIERRWDKLSRIIKDIAEKLKSVADFVLRHRYAAFFRLTV